MTSRVMQTDIVPMGELSGIGDCPMKQWKPNHFANCMTWRGEAEPACMWLTIAWKTLFNDSRGIQFCPWLCMESRFFNAQWKVESRAGTLLSKAVLRGYKIFFNVRCMYAYITVNMNDQMQNCKPRQKQLWTRLTCESVIMPYSCLKRNLNLAGFQGPRQWSIGNDESRQSDVRVLVMIDRIDNLVRVN